MGTLGLHVTGAGERRETRFSFRPVFLRIGALRDGHWSSCVSEEDAVRKPRLPSFATSRIALLPECFRRPLRSFGLWSAVLPRTRSNVTHPPGIWPATWRQCATGWRMRPSAIRSRSPQQPSGAAYRFHRTRARGGCAPPAPGPGRCAACDPHRSWRHRQDATGFAGGRRNRAPISIRRLLRFAVGGRRARIDRFRHRTGGGSARDRQSVGAGKHERLPWRAGPAHASPARQF